MSAATLNGHLSIDTVREALTRKGFTHHTVGSGFRAQCPAHGGDGHNLAVTVGQDGRLLMHCHSHGCSFESILSSLDLQQHGAPVSRLAIPRADTPEKPSNSEPMTFRRAKQSFRTDRDPDHQYAYCDADGKMRMMVCRWNTPDGKVFCPISKIEGGWIPKAMPAPRLLYRLPNVAEADIVYVCEGEKAADALTSIGLVATTSPNGSKAAGKADWSPLEGKTVVLVPDNDDNGEDYITSVAAIVHDQAPAAELHVARIAEDWPHIPEKGDAADWLEAHDAVEPETLRERLKSITKPMEYPDAVGDSPLSPGQNAASADANTATTITDDVFEPFPGRELPDVLQQFASEAAGAIGCDTTFVALPALAACASAIGTTRNLLVKRNWFVPPILWGICIGESGTVKTPGYRIATDPLKTRQKEYADQYSRELASFQEAMHDHKQKLKKWERNPCGDAPEKPEAPVRQRCLVSDATVEAVAPILSQNPRGVLLARDELSGWIAGMDKYSGSKGKPSSGVQDWLQIYNCETLLIDRKTGDAPFCLVEKPSVSIIGGIQPGILSRCLSDEHRENGLQSRLLMAYPPRQPKRWRDEEVSVETVDAYHNLIGSLYELKPDTDVSGGVKPSLLTLSGGARELFKDFVNSHGDEQNALHGHLASQWSKLEEIPARLAIVLHCVQQVTTGVEQCFEISRETMRSAISLAEWFKTECLRINRLLTEPEETREARHLIDWIRQRGGCITARDLCKYRRDIETSDEAEAKLIHLVQLGAGSWRDLRTSREFVLCFA